MLALDPRVFAPVWEVAESLLPPVLDEHPLGCHRRRVDARQCFFGIAARLVTGASWDTVGRLVGVSESTLLRRRDEWQRAGVFTRLAELALSAYDQMIGLRLDEISIDGSIHKAPMGGQGTGPSPVDRGKRGWKRCPRQRTPRNSPAPPVHTARASGETGSADPRRSLTNHGEVRTFDGRTVHRKYALQVDTASVRCSMFGVAG